MNASQLEKMHSGKGFIAALDQSGGSTPKALKIYGIPETAYHSEDEMFDLVHEMRTRIITNPTFNGQKILGAILFRQTMERKIEGIPTADFLWEKKQVVPFLKIDLGLAPEEDGVRLMKLITVLDEELQEAVRYHIFGTKERSVILAADKKGIKKIVEQQFEVALKVASYGLVPIIEPEVDIHIADKEEAEVILKEELIKHSKKLPEGTKVMFKLSLPSVDGFYSELEELPCCVRVVALSGGYTQKEANALLVHNPGVIASFSRALSEGLTASMSNEVFTGTLGASIDAIYKASIK